MSENTTDLSTNFSPEEWTLIKSAPLLAGLSVTLADLRSGIFGAIKEGIAPSQAIIEAGKGSSNPGGSAREDSCHPARQGARGSGRGIQELARFRCRKGCQCRHRGRILWIRWRKGQRGRNRSDQRTRFVTRCESLVREAKPFGPRFGFRRR